MILPCCGGGNRQASVADGMVYEKNRPQIPLITEVYGWTTGAFHHKPNNHTIHYHRKLQKLHNKEKAQKKMEEKAYTYVHK